jgi:predicted oxidoreductase
MYFCAMSGVLLLRRIGYASETVAIGTKCTWKSPLFGPEFDEVWITLPTLAGSRMLMEGWRPGGRNMQADAIVVGAGLAGLVATAELAAAGRSVLLLDQEPRASLGGQAHWSFGGLFLVDTPEQRRLGVRDSAELALADWRGTAGFAERGDEQGARWAEAYVDFAAGEKRAWLRGMGVRFFPAVGWAERGSGVLLGHGNSVPRFHVTWGTGPGVLAPFLHALGRAVDDGKVRLLVRHRVEDLLTEGGAVVGVRGAVLQPSGAARGAPSSRRKVGEFEYRAGTVLVASGGIGGDHEAVRARWPERLGPAPMSLLSGVPASVDGRMISTAQAAGASVVHTDRMWHYTEGVANWDPVWPGHGIRILPGPSSLWLDARGRRFPLPLFPGFDTLSSLAHIGTTGFEHSWFVLTEAILAKEFALSGSEQNPDLTGKHPLQVLARVRPGPPAPVGAFQQLGEDFITASTVDELAAGMNRLTGADLIDSGELAALIEAHDVEVDHPYGKDLQVAAVRAARAFPGDRLMRVAKPHRFLGGAGGRLVAVRLRILTRKSLGGIETDLQSRALGNDGRPVPGLWAAGEAAGFGGGGMHGHRSLEGTFLGGCLFSGRIAGRSMAASV